MIKKTVALFLVLVLSLSLCASSFAEEAAVDTRLADVTLKVKATLGIGDEYTSFYGNFSGNAVKENWSLNWSSDAEELRVQADGSGKVLNFYRYFKDKYSRYDDDFAPIFPKVSREDAQKAASAFLIKVLGANETAPLNSGSEILNPKQYDQYSFYGVLRLNGLDTPENVSVSVRASDLTVVNFSRNSGTVYIGDIPSPEAAVSAADAFTKLAGTNRMALQYVLSDTVKKTAELRYLPISAGNFAVDAKTGELINIYELAASAKSASRAAANYDSVEFADSEGAGPTLSVVEQEGIAKLQGVLTKEKLDAAARAIPELGLTADFSLGSFRYTLNNETGDVTAYLSYTKQVPVADGKSPSGENSRNGAAASAGNSGNSAMVTAPETKTAIAAPTPSSAPSGSASVSYTYIYKSITLDAKSGALEAVSTSYPSDDYNTKDSAETAQKGSDFLAKYFNDKFSRTALYENPFYAKTLYYGYSPSVSYYYAQQINGVFFPANNIRVSVNAEDGTIDSFGLSWTDGVSFDPADGIVSNEAACEAYSAAYEPKLSYIQIPVAVDPSVPDYQKYASVGYTYIYRMILGYTLKSSDYIYGVNAKTGQVINASPASPEKPVQYTDIENNRSIKQISTLAKYGIGFPGTSFKPAAELTQLDMLTLLLSANGMRYGDGTLTEEQINGIYYNAYSLNILTKADRDPGKLITRSDMLKIVLKMSGYGKTAELKGIYVCSFNDKQTIKAEDYGYFAIAQGMGLVSGDANGNVNPYAVLTREAAAVILYNFMSRTI